MGPLLSWTLVILVIGSVVYYYNHNPRGRSRRAQPDALRSVRRKDEKMKAGAAGAASREAPSTGSENEPTKKKKPAKKPAAPARAGAAKEEPAAAHLDAAGADDDAADKEWARQLEEKRKGTTLAPPASTTVRNKTVKQSAASAADVNFSTASSTTGADADDDLSPALSPTLAASASNGPSGGDVSDMLEAPAPGPSVLRLTESAQPVRAPKPHKPAQEPVKETKKQRQNRKKRDEAKLARQDSEDQRRVLEEKQRRTAREARGDPAKDGTASAAAARAWTAASTRPNGVAADNGPLLDTFDHGVVSASSTDGDAKAGPDWTHELPSEEEQLAMINKEIAETTGWNTVPRGKKGRKKAAPVSGDETTGNESSDAAPKAAPPKPVELEKENAHPAAPEARKFTPNAHPNDSDWAVV